MKRTTKQCLSLSLSLLMAAGVLPANALELPDVTSIVSTVKTAQNDNEQDNTQSSTDVAATEENFNNLSGTMTANNGELTLSDTGGDHFAMYNGLEKAANAFTWEADVEFADPTDTVHSAGLVFGAKSTKNVSGWCGANIDSQRVNGNDLFRVFAPGMADTNTDGQKGDIDITKKLHLRISMETTGEFVYSFGNAEEGELTRCIRGTIPNWKGGYVGLLSFQCEAKFSNIHFENRSVEVRTDLQPVTGLNFDQFHTNLGETFRKTNGTWETTENGLHSNATGLGDCFLLSETTGSNFVYSTDVTFHSDSGAAALLFRSNDDFDNKESYAVNLDIGAKKCKMWRWQKDDASQLMGETDISNIKPKEGNVYTLKMVAYGSWLSYYVNDVCVGGTGDYTITGNADFGQNTYIESGKLGLLNWNGDMTFQNTNVTPLNDTFAAPLLSDITVTSPTKDGVEGKSQFRPMEPVTIQYVKKPVETVDITATAQNKGTDITITDKNGNVYKDGKNIPVSVGSNIITVTSTTTNKDGVKATLTYRVNVHRRHYTDYNQQYRDQYHYSLKEGWANDPHGLVYFNGKYHLFHQFNGNSDEITWGPMHWCHATSTDMIHWEDQPVAMYPDANGSMFNGDVVVDKDNVSGFFDGIEGGGLVALITENGGGQRIKLAYSKDEGATWTKADDIAIDYTEDPLENPDFRDPNLFRWEGKWFMVLAGGPLRIYSSDNLTDWKCESAYNDLHTECPDLYPIQAEDGQIKWVLSRGGRGYKIGDFKQVDGNWRFVADEAYENTDGIMNFGRDSYAAITYYTQDFGTSKNPTIPTITELNWMNTWDYCRNVGSTLRDATNGEQQFNGTYNLNLNVGLTKDADGKYLLTQTPIEGYKSLRDTKHATTYSGTIAADNTVLQNFSGDCYEIVSKFKPAADTKKVGFRLRTGKNAKGEDEYTQVAYDLESGKLTLDRSKSGVLIPNDAGNTDPFAEVSGQNVTKNADGTIDLHIYVDRASIEVFSKDNTVAGANQIFPSKSSLGASVLVEGGAAQADITIYPMNSIWPSGKTEPTKPVTEVFTDVDADQWYVPYVQYVYDNDLMVGLSDTLFGPNMPLSRAMLAQILYNQAGQPAVSGKDAFTDVTKDAWYYDAVQWASQQGIVSGIGHGKFDPESNITREQFAMILYKHAGAPKVSGSLAFSDKNQVSGWAADAVLWANQNHIINGRKSGNTNLLCPKDSATRAECATMLKQYFEKTK